MEGSISPPLPRLSTKNRNWHNPPEVASAPFPVVTNLIFIFMFYSNSFHIYIWFSYLLIIFDRFANTRIHNYTFLFTNSFPHQSHDNIEAGALIWRISGFSRPAGCWGQVGSHRIGGKTFWHFYSQGHCRPWSWRRTGRPQVLFSLHQSFQNELI